MAVTKKIEIDGKEVTFKASAAVPRLYRIKFGRDIYKDLRQLEKSVGENDEDNSNLDLFSLEMFEDLAWLMARHATCVSIAPSFKFCIKADAASLPPFNPNETTPHPPCGRYFLARS